MAHPHEITAAILNGVRVIRPDLQIDRLQPELDLVRDFGLSGRGLHHLAELVEESVGVLLPPEAITDLVINGPTVRRLHQEVQQAADEAALVRSDLHRVRLLKAEAAHA